MSDAIKKLHDYLAKSPSVVYPEDVLAYLPEIEDENAKLRQQLADVTESMGRVEERRAKLQELIKHVISRYNDINREYWGNQEPLPCDLCNMERQCSEVPQRDRCLFYEHLRELGIEASK